VRNYLLDTFKGASKVERSDKTEQIANEPGEDTMPELPSEVEIQDE